VILDGEYKVCFKLTAYMLVDGLARTLEALQANPNWLNLPLPLPVVLAQAKLKKGDLFKEEFRIVIADKCASVKWADGEMAFWINAQTPASEVESRLVLKEASNREVEVNVLHGRYLLCVGDFEWARYSWDRVLPERPIEDIQSEFGLTLPAQYRLALLDESDPIHDRLLLCNGDASIFRINAELRMVDFKKWPDFLIAFATMGCGDYFAFDIRSFPYRIYYIDPIGTAAESMEACEQEGFAFASFDDWYHRERDEE
jgi:hypothetical protein